jgi:3-oxoacyl-[acyl-carrier protein] reductase
MEGAVVLITGTRKGIGRYLAEHYVQRGAQVVGCSRSAPEWTLANYTHFATDVTDEAAVRKMVAAVGKQFGRLDVLINNAGIASMNHVLLTPAATAERIFATNFQGVFLLCREAAKVMQRRRYGRIVNIGTVAVPLHLEGEAIYAASKSAVITFTQILAREVASYGITANVVAPTPIETDLIRSVPPEKIAAITARLAVKRLGRFEDVANVIDFFIRPESDYVTGQVITLGGV